MSRKSSRRTIPSAARSTRCSRSTSTWTRTSTARRAAASSTSPKARRPGRWSTRRPSSRSAGTRACSSLLFLLRLPYSGRRHQLRADHLAADLSHGHQGQPALVVAHPHVRGALEALVVDPPRVAVEAQRIDPARGRVDFFLGPHLAREPPYLAAREHLHADRLPQRQEPQHVEGGDHVPDAEGGAGLHRLGLAVLGGGHGKLAGLIGKVHLGAAVDFVLVHVLAIM